MKPAASTHVADLADGDAAFAHQAAIVEQVGRRRLPVADVEGEQTPGSAREFDLRPRVRDPTRRDTHPPRCRATSGEPSASQISCACAIVLTALRSSAYIGCSGSMASFTPACSAAGSTAAMPSAICLRDSVQALPGTAPHTRTMSGAPIACACSMACRLSSMAACRPCGRRRREEPAAAQAHDLKPRVRSLPFHGMRDHVLPAPVARS